MGQKVVSPVKTYLPIQSPDSILLGFSTKADGRSQKRLSRVSHTPRQRAGESLLALIHIYLSPDQR